jgi:ankyrin repeat protein
VVAVVVVVLDDLQFPVVPVDFSNPVGMTPLMISSLLGHQETSMLLIENGAPIRVCTTINPPVGKTVGLLVVPGGFLMRE